MAVTRPIDSCEVTDATLAAAKKAIRVSVPGVIKSFDPDSVTCDVEISVFGLQPQPVAGVNAVDRLDSDNVFYPLILDAPVVFPRGGGVTLTFPFSRVMNAWLFFRSLYRFLVAERQGAKRFARAHA
jgi:hypothetical protein